MAIIESVASSRRKVKENVRLEGLIPEQLREDSEALTEMMNSYYEFMNLFGHYYKKSEVSHYATVINGEILFRADANTYFYDIDFTDSILYDSDSNPITFDTRKAYIMGTDNLPDALADDETTYGTLFQIEADEIENYTSQQLRLVTPIIVYVGDAPSFAINSPVLSSKLIYEFTLVVLKASPASSPLASLSSVFNLKSEVSAFISIF